jgi:PAS domain S-box-containing protein
MNQQEIEVILARQLADYLALPIFLVDQEGNLLFYNEPAEKILGHRYEETGPMPALEWATVFQPTDEDGRSLPANQLPLIIALQESRPAHSGFWIRGLDGVLRQIEVMAFPLIGQSDRRLGAVAIFWEMPA